MSASGKAGRRKFLKAGVSVGVGLGLAGICRKAQGGNDRPNILIILVDQDRYPMHTPPLSRPTRDRLRNNGIEFTKAFCAYPLCSPSRATLLTGKYPHQVGILTNTDFYGKNPSLSPELPNLGRVFSQADYGTAWFGKWHLCRSTGNSAETQKYGFDRIRISSQLFGLGRDQSTIAHAASWIKDQTGASKPWLCVCSALNPHDICYPPIYGLYGKIPQYPVSLPPNFVKDAGEIYAPFAAVLNTPATRSQIPKNEEQWISYLRHYCYFTELIDRQTGALLDALAQAGQLEKTVVIYTSDHGEMAGSHGLVNKSMSMYEENLHIPLVISRPGLKASSHDGLVSHLDLVPTLCGLSGVAWPEPLPGIDLSPLLSARAIPERGQIFAEGRGELNTTPPWRGLRTKKWKYWQYLDGAEFLFDLEKDAYEITNLAGEKTFWEIALELRSQVRAFRRETQDPFKEFL